MRFHSDATHACTANTHKSRAAQKATEPINEPLEIDAVALGEGHDSPDDGRLTYFSVESARVRIDDIDGSSREIAWE